MRVSVSAKTHLPYNMSHAVGRSIEDWLSRNESEGHSICGRTILLFLYLIEKKRRWPIKD